VGFGEKTAIHKVTVIGESPDDPENARLRA
jgi:hypothetical protein